RRSRAFGSHRFSLLASNQNLGGLSGLAFHQPWQFSNVPASMAHEEAPRRSNGIDDAKPQIAQMAQRRDVVGEQPVQRIGRSGKGKGIEPPPAFIALKR